MKKIILLLAIVLAAISVNADCETDEDHDGVNDCDDICPNSKLDKIFLNKNHYAQNINFGKFEIGPEVDRSSIYDMQATRGCTCAQIIGMQNIGKKQLRKGCSAAIMKSFTGISERLEKKN